MRKLLFFLVALLPVLAAAQYDHQGVRLLGRVALNQMPGNPSAGAGCTGYTSPSGREYGIMGVRNGIVVVDITEPTAPNLIGHIPGPNSQWWEVTTLGEYAYAVTEAGGGVRIIDLRQADQGIVTLAGTYTGNGLNNVHTIQANAQTGHLYLNGSNRGFLILDASNPEQLAEIGRWTTRYVHDSHIVVYDSGPYAGREIAFLCCASHGLYIVDITNKSNLQLLGSVRYHATGGYCHSGQLTPDKKYFLINDEFDESNGIFDSMTTIIVDVQDLTNPVHVANFTNGLPVIDHNSDLRGDYLYLAAYRAGLRIYDVRNPLAMKEVGHFDTYPAGYGFNYSGNWDVYARFPSGNVVLSDMQRGLFVVDPSEAIGRGAPVMAVTTWNGEITGGPKELRDADGKFVELKRNTTRGLGFIARYRTSFTPPQTLDFRVEGQGPGTLMLEVKNKNTGEFDLVGQFQLGSSSTVHTFTGVAAANYVNADLEIEVRLREAVEPNLRSVVYKIDQLKVEVSR
jgi:choice-of-anchor B domain-containing protein